MNDKKIFLSVIVPVYNEEKRIGNLKKIINFFKNKNYSTEILVVNDGSIDKTLNVLENLNKKNSFKIISYKINKGKGYAIKQGIFNARGQFILFTDIDLSTPLKEFDGFYKYINEFDIIIASRKHLASKLIEHQPKLRKFLSSAFLCTTKFILSLEFSDLTCGFKCFSRRSARLIFNKLTIDGWGFDSELLYIARKKGLQIKEVPVSWKNDPRTKVKFPQDIIKTFIDIIKIRINDLGGAY